MTSTSVQLMCLSASDPGSIPQSIAQMITSTVVPHVMEKASG